MYPAGELSELAARKAALRLRIAARRTLCVAHAAHVGTPLSWLNRLHARWRQISPLVRLAVVPIGLWLTRPVRGGRRLLRTVMRWGPAIFQLARSFYTARA